MSRAALYAGAQCSILLMESILFAISPGIWQAFATVLVAAFALEGIRDWSNKREAKPDAFGVVPRINAALTIAREVYSGTGGPRPDSDEDQLLDMANWLDRIDNQADAGMKAMGVDHPVGRDMQADLRRIAGLIRDRGCDGTGGCCAS